MKQGEKLKEKLTFNDIQKMKDDEILISDRIPNVTKLEVKSQDKIIGYILESSNYDKFVLSRKLNRKTISAHIKNMQKSVSELDLGEDFPILVDKEFRVIDGQHRFLARKNLKLPIFYKITKRNYSARELFLVNKYVRKWTNEAFIDKLAQEGDESAIQVLKDIEKYDVPLSIYLRAIDIHISDEMIINGKFKYNQKHRDKAYELFYELETFKPYPFWKNHRFIQAYIHVRTLNNYKYRLMQESVKKYPDILVWVRSRSKMLFKMIEVYNYNRRKEQRIPYPHQDIFEDWGDA